MHYAKIKKMDVADGPGIRVSLFVSGCTHRCKGCFNSETWDFGYGQEYTEQTQEEILQALAPDYIRGLSVLGGEPMEPENRCTVLALVEEVRRRYPEKDIWCYTGYDYEKDLLPWVGCLSEEPGNDMARLLACVDVLVDGEFVEAEKDLRLAFRGSGNQRLIDVQQSLRLGRTVCLPEVLR